MAINFTMQRFVIIFLLSVCFQLVPVTVTEAAIWPFRSSVSSAPAEEQTRLSKPYFERGVAAREAGNKRTALRNFKRVYNRYPVSTYAAPSLLYTGEIQMERRKWDKALEAFQTLLIRHPEFPRFNEILNHQYEMAVALAEGDGVRLLGLFPYRAYNRSVSHFENLINNAPYSDLAPLALMNVARIHQHQGNTAEAIDALDRLINNYPASTLTDIAYLELAQTFSDLVTGPEYDQGATREAISYYQDFLILFPNNERVEEGEVGLSENLDVLARSKLLIGEFYFRHRSAYRAAEIFFNEAITVSPTSPSADRARAYLARIEEFRRRAAEDPNYRMPRVTWGDYLFFWRGQREDFRIDEIDPSQIRSVEDLPSAPVGTPQQAEPASPLRDED
jgi:outer membrane protein assembly factor BamD